MYGLSHKKVKVYSIVEEEVCVPEHQGVLEWYLRDTLSLDQPLSTMLNTNVKINREPIHVFCERFCKVPRHHPDYPHKECIEGLWETVETFVAFKHSDKDGFMKYLTELIDGARREKQYEVDRKQAQIEKLEGQLYRTQVNLEHLDSKVNNATFWKRLKYLFGGDL